MKITWVKIREILSKITQILPLISYCLFCTPSVTKYSGRNPDLFQKPSDKLIGESRGLDPGKQQPEVFIKEKKLIVKDLQEPNTTGSLFQSDHDGNYLFVPGSTGKIGRFLTIQVKTNRKNIDDKKADSQAKGDGKNKSQSEKSQEEEELLKALPDLEPKDRSKISLLKDFKMRITHRFPNGDILAKLERESTSESDFHQTVIEARIPYDRMTSGETLTTDDLLDIKYNEVTAEETIKRQSSDWQDEYSLRLSGFNEAQSRVASELADQKAKLSDAKQRLQDRIKSIGAERRQLTKMREEYSQRKAESETKLKEATDKVEESEEIIQDQKDTIQEQQQKLEDIEGKKAAADNQKGGKDG
jgi:hypothetical protein